MKKFLTVLLALSVVFTYSFSAVGTAFAADGTTDTPYDIALDKIDAKAATVKADAAKEGVYDSAAIAKAIEEATKAGYTKAQALYETYIVKADPDNETQFYAELENWIATEFDKAYDAEVINADYAIKIAAAKELVGAIKTTDYVDKDQKTVADYKAKVLNALDTVEAKESGVTIKSLWRDDVTEWPNQPTLSYRDAINIYLYGATAGWAKIYNADDKLSDVISGTKGEFDVKGLFVMLDELTTVEEDKEDSEITQAYIDNIIANITYNAKAAEDGFYLTKRVAAGDSVTLDSNKEYYGVKVANASKITAAEAAAINDAMLAAINDTLEVVAVRVQWVADEFGKSGLDTQVEWYKNHANFQTAMTKAIAAKDFYGDVAAYAAEMKAAVNFAGEKKYNDADIDKALADAKYAIYGGYYEGGFGTVASYFNKVMPIYDDVALAIKVATDKWQDEIKYYGDDKTAEADMKYCANYYAGYKGNNVAPTSVDWQKKYTAIKADAVEALNDAKTIDEVNAIMADADSSLAKLRTAANDTLKLKAEIEKYIEALEKYADEQAKLVDTKDKYLQASYDAAEAAGVKILKAVAKTDDLANAYNEAKALFSKIKDKAALKAEASDVQNKIIALPTTSPKLENEAAYMAAYDAYMTYLDNYGANKADVRDHYALETAMTNLKALQLNAVKEAIRQMNADKVVTRTEYEAVKAMYDKYVEYYDQYGEEFETTPYTYKAQLATAAAQLWQNEVNTVKNMIAKLTTSSSLADVLAAKEAYEALTGSQQRAVMHEFGTAWIYKLELMKEAQISAVESLKITASSTAAKGSITVKWTVKGDYAAADGYRVYKSKKMNSGYGTKPYFQTKDSSKMSYKNTKELKKGTRYYYKVRAYVVIDGKTYFSDYSNKAYRIAK